ncbi:MAG: histidine triad nucleotide-binding protein [Nitrospirota bacterium]
MGCIFCEIIDKKRPSRIIYEDEFVVAFDDINPQAPVHVLIIPRKHMPTTLDLSGEDEIIIGYMFRIANEIAKSKGVAERGFRLVLNNNPESGQTIYHVHLHLLGGRWMRWPPG